MVIDGGGGFLSFWRPGDKLWTRTTTHLSAHFDVTYHKGQFYAVDARGNVVVCDVLGPNPKETKIVAQAPCLASRNYYVVESSGSLLIVIKDGKLDPVGEERGNENEPRGYEITTQFGRFFYGTIGFRVLQLDLEHGGAWTEVEDLGDRALFLGHSASVSIDEASRLPGIKANCIYFSDDWFELYLMSEEGGGRDMGVYNLADGSISPHYRDLSISSICPPVWVVPKLS